MNQGTNCPGMNQPGGGDKWQRGKTAKYHCINIIIRWLKMEREFGGVKCPFLHVMIVIVKFTCQLQRFSFLHRLLNHITINEFQETCRHSRRFQFKTTALAIIVSFGQNIQGPCTTTPLSSCGDTYTAGTAAPTTECVLPQLLS